MRPTDAQDADNDGDGIPTAAECPNGVPCPDSDGDTIPDYLESDNQNTDGDGQKDHQDGNGDGIPDAVEGIADTDGDGMPDNQDLDSEMMASLTCSRQEVRMLMVMANRMPTATVL